MAAGDCCCAECTTARCPPSSPLPPAQEINKPGEFASEHAFMQKVWGSNSCVRHYFLLWHAAYRRAGLRLPAPYWEGPPVPDYNLTHDRVVRACQNCELECRPRGWVQADTDVPSHDVQASPTPRHQSTSSDTAGGAALQEKSSGAA